MSDIHLLLHRSTTPDPVAFKHCLQEHDWRKDHLWEVWLALDTRPQLVDNAVVLIHHFLEQKTFIIADSLKWVPQICHRAEKHQRTDELNAMLDAFNDPTSGVSLLAEIHAVEMMFRQLKSDEMKCFVVQHSLSFSLLPRKVFYKDVAFFVAQNSTNKANQYTDVAQQHAQEHIQPKHILSLLNSLVYPHPALPQLKVDQCIEHWFDMIRDKPDAWWNKADQLWQEGDSHTRQAIQKSFPQWEVLLTQTLLHQVVDKDRPQAPLRKI